MKIVLKFKFTERDILLHRHYGRILRALQKELGNKITVTNGAVHRGYRRGGNKKWKEEIFHDLVVFYSKDVEDKVLKAVA